MTALTPTRGAQRVAAFLLSLEPAAAAAVLKTLASDVVAPVAQAMIDLDPRLARAGVADDLALALARALDEPQPVRPVAALEVETLLGQAFGRRASRYVKRVRAARAANRPFLALETQPPAAVVEALRHESLAVKALVLAHLDAERAARILRHVPEDEALALVSALVTLEAPSPGLVRTVAAELARRLEGLAPPSPAADPLERIRSVAEILNRSAPGLDRKALELLARTDERAAEELREQLFAWDDLATLGRRAMSRLLGQVDTRTLALALKGCSASVERSVFAALSTRVRAIVREERELAGAVPADDVRSARSEVLREARALIEAGEFRPRRGGEPLVS
jgi:flagellar motor switch protein FliG